RRFYHGRGLAPPSSSRSWIASALFWRGGRDSIPAPDGADRPTFIRGQFRSDPLIQAGSQKVDDPIDLLGPGENLPGPIEVAPLPHRQEGGPIVQVEDPARLEELEVVEPLDIGELHDLARR